MAITIISQDQANRKLGKCGKLGDLRFISDSAALTNLFTVSTVFKSRQTFRL